MVIPCKRKAPHGRVWVCGNSEILGSSKCKQQCRTSYQKPHLHNVRLGHGVAQLVWKCHISTKGGENTSSEKSISRKKASFGCVCLHLYEDNLQREKIWLSFSSKLFFPCAIFMLIKSWLSCLADRAFQRRNSRDNFPIT